MLHTDYFSLCQSVILSVLSHEEIYLNICKNVRENSLLWYTIYIYIYTHTHIHQILREVIRFLKFYRILCFFLKMNISMVLHNGRHVCVCVWYNETICLWITIYIYIYIEKWCWVSLFQAWRIYLPWNSTFKILDSNSNDWYWCISLIHHENSTFFFLQSFT